MPRCAHAREHVAMSLCASPLHGSMHTSCGLRIMCVVVCAGHGGERRRSHHTSHCARPTAQLTRTPPSSHRWSGSARAASSSAAAVAAALLGRFRPSSSSFSRFVAATTAENATLKSSNKLLLTRSEKARRANESARFLSGSVSESLMPHALGNFLSGLSTCCVTL